MLTTDSFERPHDLRRADDPAVRYVKSYLLIRTVVGFIGFALPIAFIVGEAFFLRGSVRVRGSLSAYYHSPMRDLFVAALAVTGFLLLTYMAGQRDTADFWLSTVAGTAVLIVAFCPTYRPGGGPRCGTLPEPAGCSPIQQLFGEARVAHLHLAAAAVFILSLAAIAYVFARRERKYNDCPGVAAVQRGCCYVIVVAVLFVLVGNALHWRVGPLTPLYLTEVVSVWAFGVSWLLAGRALLGRILLPAVSPPPTEVAPAA